MKRIYYTVFKLAIKSYQEDGQFFEKCEGIVEIDLN